MKKILLGFLLISFFVACGTKEVEFSKLQNRNGIFYQVNQEKGFSGIAKKYYKDKTLKESITIKNGVFSGPTETFFQNGQTKYSGFYTNGKLAIEKSYYENGQVKTEFVNKKNNEKLYKEYYENGAIKNSVPFVNDVPSGEAKTFYRNGNIKRTINFSNGKATGPAVEYDQNGNVIKNYNFFDKIMQYTEDFNEQLKGN